MMDHAALVRTLAQRVGIADDFDPSQPLPLLIDRDMTVVIEPTGFGGSLFLAELKAIAGNDMVAAMRGMLERNLKNRRNAPSFLCLDPRRDMAVLCRHVRDDDVQRFQAAFEDFVSEAKILRNEPFAAAGAAAATPQPEDWTHLPLRA